jgi:2-C-methyl-D-erythritol 4-phosphate cytidylyltransferase
MSRFAVILPAAGKSSRFGSKEKKVFAPLDGRAVWLRSAEAFVNRDDVVQTIVVIAPEDEEMFRLKFGSHIAVLSVEIVLGGKERFDSVANALAKVRDAEFVAIHDAARPCVTSKMIDDVFHIAAKTGAAMLAVQISDTVKKADVTGKVLQTVPREGLWLAQTPQVFRRDWLTEAYAKRGSLAATDDAQLIEALGHAVHLVPADASNLKITTPSDLTLAANVIKSRPAPKGPKMIHPFEDEIKW